MRYSSKQVNELRDQIKFTMEKEKDCCLLLLDTLMHWNDNGTISILLCEK